MILLTEQLLTEIITSLNPKRKVTVSRLTMTSYRWRFYAGSGSELKSVDIEHREMLQNANSHPSLQRFVRRILEKIDAFSVYQSITWREEQADFMLTGIDAVAMALTPDQIPF
jgi:hypothetical protein